MRHAQRAGALNTIFSLDKLLHFEDLCFRVFRTMMTDL